MRAQAEGLRRGRTGSRPSDRCIPRPRSDDVAINDFAFKIATVNGTGSASANGLLMQAIFRMGIPVTGKNVFPSNIQGLPTWYEIRVSKDGYTARPAHVDLVVALNPETYAKDVAAVRPGGYLIYDSSWPLDRRARCARTSRSSACRSAQLCVENFEGDRKRTLHAATSSTSARSPRCSSIDMDVVGEMLARDSSRRSARCSTPTSARIQLGYDYAKENYDCPLPFRLERDGRKTKDSILIDGNTAGRARLRVCRRDGRRVVSDHAVDVADGGVQGVLRAYRVDPETEQQQYAFIQAEDELAAAAW